MRISHLQWFLALALFFVLVSCERASPKVPATLGRETLTDASAIPSKFGNLIAVTPTHEGTWARLWFQDSEGVIRTVGHNLVDNRLEMRCRVIPRN